MPATKSPLETLIEFPKDAEEEARREILRLNTDAFITAADRYGCRQNEYFDLMFSRVALQMDRQLRRCLAMAMAKSGVDPDHVKRLLSGKDKSISLLLRRSSTQTVPDLVNIIRERSTMQFNAPRRAALDAEDLMDGSRFTLPKLLVEELYRFDYFALRKTAAAIGDENILNLLDRTAKRFRPAIIESSQGEVREEILRVTKHINELSRVSKLTEGYVSELLLTDNTTELTLGLCAMLHVDSATLQRILNDTTWESLALACRGAGISRTFFTGLVNSMNRRESDQVRSKRIITLYNTIPVDAAERVMRFWQVRASSLAEATDHDVPRFDATEPVAAPVKPAAVSGFDKDARKALFG